MTQDSKKLYRSLDERMLAGVCGGLGKYLNTDPTVIRILFVVLTLIGFGGGIILYLAMWLIVPEEPLAASAPPSQEKPEAEQKSEETTVEDTSE